MNKLDLISPEVKKELIEFTQSLVHRIENITSNIGKIEFPFIDMRSYEIMDISSH